MTILTDLLYSLLTAVGSIYILLIALSPIIFFIFHIRNVRKYKKMKKEWDGETGGAYFRALNKKKDEIIVCSVALAVVLAIYLVIQFAFVDILFIFLPLLIAYSFPWYFTAFAVISRVRFVSYKGKDGDTEEAVIKERKKRKWIFIISSVVAVITFILYFTVVLKSLSEISFM